MCWIEVMGFREELIEGIAPLVDLVFPPRCPLCGEGIARQEGLCTECWSTLAIPGEPACKACLRPLMGSGASDNMLCGECLKQLPRHRGIAAATLYDETSRRLVLMFKHGRKIALAPVLARLIAARLKREEGEPVPLLVPVPLHRRRIWRRGYNQSALLARELARLGRGEIAIDLLERRKHTPSLRGFNASERRRLLRGAIAVRKRRKAMLKGREVILVDDVYTSGATSDACVAALLGAGAANVKIACFSRVLYEALDHFNAVGANETPEVLKTPGAT